jgi:uncharacterized protein (DUF433 family)
MRTTYRKAGTVAMTLDWTRHLTRRRGICAGQLCASGTRVPVATILDSLAEGASIADIVRSYPTLTATHVRAAIAYAAELAREEELAPLVDHAPQARRESSRRAG